MTVASNGVYGNFLLNKNSKFVTYNLHQGIILSYIMKSYVLQFVRTKQSEVLEVYSFA